MKVGSIQSAVSGASLNGSGSVYDGHLRHGDLEEGNGLKEVVVHHHHYPPVMQQQFPQQQGQVYYQQQRREEQEFTQEEFIRGIFNQLIPQYRRLLKAMLNFNMLPSVERKEDPLSTRVMERSIFWMFANHPFITIVHYNLPRFGDDCKIMEDTLMGMPVRGVYEEYITLCMDLVWDAFQKMEGVTIYQEIVDGETVVSIGVNEDAVDVYGSGETQGAVMEPMDPPEADSQGTWVGLDEEDEETSIYSGGTSTPYQPHQVIQRGTCTPTSNSLQEQQPPLENNRVPIRPKTLLEKKGE